LPAMRSEMSSSTIMGALLASKRVQCNREKQAAIFGYEPACGGR
jgi:hypothetical protein